MLMKGLLALFCLAMAGGGVGMVLSPSSFVIDANPTLQLLKKHLPDWLVFRMVQAMGLFLVVAFLGFFFVEFIF